MKLQKLGGYSSIAWVLIGIVSGALAHSVFQGFTGSDYHDPGKMISAYQTFPMAFYTWYALGILKAVLILIIVLALEERMQKDAPNLMRIAITALALILPYLPQQ